MDDPSPRSTGPSYDIRVIEEEAGNDQERLVSLAALVLEREGLPEATELSIVLVSDETIADLNEKHLGKTGATDVLSFPLEHLAPGAVPARVVGGPPLNLGDVVIAPAYVSRQAGDLGVPVHDEIALLLVHGILHLLGWDHANEQEAEAMEDRERSLLALVGVDRR